MCTPLATAIGLLILLVSFCHQDASASVNVLTCYYCLIVLTCMLHLPLQSPMSTSIFILLTSLSARGFHLVLLTCIVLFYYRCIVLLHCVFAYPLQSSVSTGLSPFSSPTCLLVCISLAGRTIYFVTCILTLTLTFLAGNLFASTLFEGSCPCPHPYNLLLG